MKNFLILGKTNHIIFIDNRLRLQISDPLPIKKKEYIIFQKDQILKVATDRLKSSMRLLFVIK